LILKAFRGVKAKMAKSLEKLTFKGLNDNIKHGRFVR
jgi:hypothetical protein